MSDASIKFYFGCRERAFTYDDSDKSWKSADGYVAKKFYGHDTITILDNKGARVATGIKADLSKVGSIYIENGSKEVHLFGKDGRDSARKTLDEYRKALCSSAPAVPVEDPKVATAGRKLTSVNTISLPFSEKSTVPTDGRVIVTIGGIAKTIIVDSYYYKKIEASDKYELHIVTGSEEFTAATDLTQDELKSISYSIIFDEYGKIISVRPQYSENEFALTSPLDILKDSELAPFFNALKELDPASAKIVTDGLAQIAKKGQKPAKEKLVTALKGMLYKAVLDHKEIASLLPTLNAGDRKMVEDGLKTIIYDRNQIPAVERIVAAIQNLPSYKASVAEQAPLEILKDSQVAPFFNALKELDPASAKIVTDGLAQMAQKGQRPAKDKLVTKLKDMVYKAVLAHAQIAPLLREISNDDRKIVEAGLKRVIFDNGQIPVIDKVVAAIQKLPSYKAKTAEAAPAPQTPVSSREPIPVAEPLPKPEPEPARVAPEPPPTSKPEQKAVTPAPSSQPAPKIYSGGPSEQKGPLDTLLILKEQSDGIIRGLSKNPELSELRLSFAALSEILKSWDENVIKLKKDEVTYNDNLRFLDATRKRIDSTLARFRAKITMLEKPKEERLSEEADIQKLLEGMTVGTGDKNRDAQVKKIIHDSIMASELVGVYAEYNRLSDLSGVSDVEGLLARTKEIESLGSESAKKVDKAVSDAVRAMRDQKIQFGNEKEIVAFLKDWFGIAKMCKEFRSSADAGTKAFEIVEAHALNFEAAKKRIAHNLVSGTEDIEGYKQSLETTYNEWKRVSDLLKDFDASLLPTDGDRKDVERLQKILVTPKDAMPQDVSSFTKSVYIRVKTKELRDLESIVNETKGAINSGLVRGVMGATVTGIPRSTSKIFGEMVVLHPSRAMQNQKYVVSSDCFDAAKVCGFKDGVGKDEVVVEIVFLIAPSNSTRLNSADKIASELAKTKEAYISK